MSGLIATNGKEIQELRTLGDRNIYEFTITKKNGMQKVGDVQMRLTKSDAKHNRFTMVVMADDKMIEKKTRPRTSRVQFYAPAAAASPTKWLSTKLARTKLRDTPATPKVSSARNYAFDDNRVV